jgi:hypothetical protein
LPLFIVVADDGSGRDEKNGRRIREKEKGER